MKRIAYTLGLLLIVFTSCKHEKDTGDNLPAETTLALNYKNTAVSLDSLLLLYKSEVVKKIYKKKGYTTIWHNKQDREALLKAIEESEFDGLFPEDYNLAVIKKLKISRTSTSMNLLSMIFC